MKLVMRYDVEKNQYALAQGECESIPDGIALIAKSYTEFGPIPSKIVIETTGMAHADRDAVDALSEQIAEMTEALTASVDRINELEAKLRAYNDEGQPPTATEPPAPAATDAKPETDKATGKGR